MNKDQFARLQRHRKVKQRLADFATTIAKVPALATLVAQYLGKLQLLDGAAQRKPVTSQGATLAKSTTGTALIARLVKAANALYLFYKAQTPPNLADALKLHRVPSDYTNLTDLELATEAVNLSQQVQAHKAALATSYSLTPAAAKVLQDDADLYGQQLTAPALAIDAAKIKSATNKNTLSELNRFLKDDLRAGFALLLGNEGPDAAAFQEAYDQLREATQVDDPRYGKGGGKGVTKTITPLEDKAGTGIQSA